MATEKLETTSVDEVLDAVDSALVILAKLMNRIDFETIEKLLDIIPNLEKMLPLLERLSQIPPEKLDPILELLEKSPQLVASLDKLMPLLEKLDPATLEGLLDKLPTLLPLLEKIPELEPLLDRLPTFARLLEGIDDKTIASIEKLMNLLPLVAEKAEAATPCLEEALKRMEEAKPVAGLRGLLGALRDKEVQEGLGKVMEILRVLGRCKL